MSSSKLLNGKYVHTFNINNMFNAFKLTHPFLVCDSKYIFFVAFFFLHDSPGELGLLMVIFIID